MYLCVWSVGALRVLFDVLYDDELVSEESFLSCISVCGL